MEAPVLAKSQSNRTQSENRHPKSKNVKEHIINLENLDVKIK